MAQIDLEACKVAAAPELMQGLTRTLIIEYKDHALRQAEALEHRLAVSSVLFFFLPFLFLVLAPLLPPLLTILCVSTESEPLLALLVALYLLPCAVQDLRTRHVSNWLTILAFLLAWPLAL